MSDVAVAGRVVTIPPLLSGAGNGPSPAPATPASDNRSGISFMSNHADMLALIRSMSGQANILTIPRVYVTLCNGEHRTALVLNQCVFWSDKGKDPEGWFYKTYDDWRIETGIPKHGMMTAFKNLAKKTLVETKVKKVRGDRALHCRVNMEVLVKCIIATLESAESALSESAENARSSYQLNTTVKMRAKRAPVSSKPIPITDTKTIQSTYEALIGYRLNGEWAAGESKAAKQIGMVYTAEQLAEAYHHYKSQPFYADKRVTLRYLAREMPELFKGRDEGRGEFTPTRVYS